MRTHPTEPIGDAPALRGPVMMGQAWRDLTFLHWAVPPAQAQAHMPPGVHPDVRDGVTYVGLVPFRMVGAGVGRGPGVPWAGTFLETNVRLYSVDATGRRGVVFCTLECSRLPVVLGAKAAFGLPYRWSSMAFGHRPSGLPVGSGSEVAYLTRGRGSRVGVGSRVVVEVGEALAPGDEAGADDVALARWLSNRWGLHQAHAGRTWYVPNAHEAWPLHRARVVTLEDDLLAASGFKDLAHRPPDHAVFSPGVRTRFGLPGDARTPRAGVTLQR